MAKVVVFRKNSDGETLMKYIKTKILQKYWHEAGWTYSGRGGSSGNTLSFTRIGREFNGTSAIVESEPSNVIKVIGEDPIKLIRGLLKGYKGPEVLIEIK